MLRLFLTVWTGWAVVVLLVGASLVPFYLRRIATAGPQPPSPSERLAPHRAMGYAAGVFVVLHAVLPLLPPSIRDANRFGLSLAMSALALVAAQVALGLKLRIPGLPDRLVTRRLHLWALVAIAILVLGHVILNGRTVGLLGG